MTFYELLLDMEQLPNVIRVALSFSQVVRIQNVADYYLAIGAIKGVRFPEDFPNLAPSFDNMFMEWELRLEDTNIHFGHVFFYKEHDGWRENGGPRWEGTMITLIGAGEDLVIRDGNYVHAFLRYSVMVDGSFSDPSEILLSPLASQFAQGIVEGDPARKELGIHLAARYFSDIPLLALSFMHCNNVQIEERGLQSGKRRTRGQNRSQPEYKHYVLRIDAIKHILERVGQVGEHGIAQALHICRGHFRTYTEDGPLFGKHTGTFFVSQHLRGVASAGQVRKDYDIGVPDG
jgi:hypothetical protein